MNKILKRIFSCYLSYSNIIFRHATCRHQIWDSSLMSLSLLPFEDRREYYVNVHFSIYSALMQCQCQSMFTVLVLSNFFHLSNRETSHLSLLLYSWGFLCLIWNPTVMGLRYFKTKYMEIFSCRIELESLCPTPLCFGILSPWTVVSSYLKWKLECFPSACIVGAFSELKVWVDLPPHPLESHDPPKLMICLSGWLIFCESVGWKQTSRSMALNQGWLSPPADIWQKSQDVFGGTLGVGAPGIQKVEARAAVKHPAHPTPYTHSRQLPSLKCP